MKRNNHLLPKYNFYVPDMSCWNISLIIGGQPSAANQTSRILANPLSSKMDAFPHWGANFGNYSSELSKTEQLSVQMTHKTINNPSQEGSQYIQAETDWFLDLTCPQLD